MIGLALVALATLACAPPSATPELRSVRLASAVAGEGWVELEVVTEVAAGPLIGETPCSSIFDGASLVLCDASGAEIARQAHGAHCSPYDHGHPVELADGTSRTVLRFPLEPGPRAASARLEGTLAGREDVPVRSDEVALR